MRVLITGAGGLLGGRLAELLSGVFEVVAGYHVSPPPPGLAATAVDLASPSCVSAVFDQIRPDGIVHCAALADADRCEREPELALRLNVRAPELLAERCGRAGVRLVALSTDLVFRGDRPFVDEQTPADPLLAYARTKLMGERAILDQAPGSAVARIALVHGRGHGVRASASESIVWALRSGRRIRLFTDQYRTPIDPESIAAAIGRLLVGSQSGLFHLGGPERLSRHALGLRVARCWGLPTDSIERATQFQSGLAAPRPPDVSLDSSRARRELAWQPRLLDQAIREGRPTPDIIP